MYDNSLSITKFDKTMESNGDMSVEAVNKADRRNKYSNNLKKLEHREKYMVIEQGKGNKHKRDNVGKMQVNEKCKKYERREKKKERESQNKENYNTLEENKKKGKGVAGCAETFVEESDEILDRRIEDAENEIQELRSKLDYLQKERCQYMKEYEEDLTTDDKRRRLLEQKEKLLQVKEIINNKKFLERETLVSLLDLSISLWGTENTKTPFNVIRFLNQSSIPSTGKL